MNVKIQDIIKIAEKADDIILDIYKEDFNVDFKVDDSPLTIADKLASDYICSNLNKLYPNIPIICEETKNDEYIIREKYEYVWIVDPLDGTKEFIKKNGEFTVNIGLVKNNKPILGVVTIPCQKKTYYAELNKGAYLKENNKLTKLKVNTFNFKDKNLRIVCSRSHLNNVTENFLKNFEDPIIVRSGSSLKFMLIAEGKADIYPRLAPTMEWDTCASQIIVEESEGKVLIRDNVKLSYNKENLRNPDFITYGNINS
jgi:3'(2'), 5'-bisphosphate nucleotidase